MFFNTVCLWFKYVIPIAKVYSCIVPLGYFKGGYARCEESENVTKTDSRYYFMERIDRTVYLYLPAYSVEWEFICANWKLHNRKFEDYFSRFLDTN